MSIVTRGMGRPDALVASWGYGVGASIVVVIPVEQSQQVLETLQATGVTDITVSTATVDNQVVALLEFRLDTNVTELAQIASVIDRSLTVGVEEINVSVQLGEVNQTTELVEVIQAVAVLEPEVTIQVLEIGEEVKVYEAIDKIEGS